MTNISKFTVVASLFQRFVEGRNEECEKEEGKHEHGRATQEYRPVCARGGQQIYDLVVVINILTPYWL